jgi:Pentapeptide repeats (9 copies)
VAVQLWRRGHTLDVRGCRIDDRRFRCLLRALSHVSIKHGPQAPRRLRPTGCGEIKFQGALFEDNVSFRELTFPGQMLFDGARFMARADFGLVTFTDHADFDNVVFESDANFRGAVFQDHAGFEKGRFMGDATFTSVTFSNNVDFDGAIFRHSARMDGIKFLGARRLGRITVGEAVTLESSEFAVRTAIEIRARHVNARSLVLADGGRISLHGESVQLAQADLGRASTLEGTVWSGPLLMDWVRAS